MAQTLIRYPFSAYVKRAVAGTGLAGLDFTVGAGASASILEGLGYQTVTALIATNNTTAMDAASAIANDVYVQFTLAVSGGYKIQFTDLVAQLARGGAATPRGYVLRSSLDGYTANLSTSDIGTQRPTISTLTIDLTSLPEISGVVTFRLYYYTPTSAQSIDIIDLSFNGNYTLTPSVAQARFAGISDVVGSELSGRVRGYQWRKLPSAVTTAGIWFDLATTSGNPKQKNWFDAAPLVATQVKQSTDGGIFHGANVPAQKILRKTTQWCNSATPLPMSMILCDYLLYYPTIDDSETGQQDLDNTLPLPRYTTGAGVQVMAVTLAARTGGQSFYFTYTNSQGISGRISQTVAMNTSSVIGTITTSFLTPNIGCAAPFIGLQDGDTGVQSIQSVQMLGPDTGLFALVLVKPLGETQIKETGIPVETDYLLHKLEATTIVDDAYLNFLCLPNGSMSGTTLMGTLKPVWN